MATMSPQRTTNLGPHQLQSELKIFHFLALFFCLSVLEEIIPVLDASAKVLAILDAEEEEAKDSVEDGESEEDA